MKQADKNRLTRVIDRLVIDLSARAIMILDQETRARVLTDSEGFSCAQVAIAFLAMNLGAGAKDQKAWRERLKATLDWPEVIEHQKNQREAFIAAQRKRNIKGV